MNSGGALHGGVLGLIIDQAVGDAVRTLCGGDMILCECLSTLHVRRSAREFD